MIVLGIPNLSNIWVLTKSKTTLASLVRVAFTSIQLDHNQQQEGYTDYQIEQDQFP